MRVHIWIRKENEAWWKEHGSSAWVNEVISFARTGYTDFSSPEDAQKALAIMAAVESGTEIQGPKSIKDLLR